MAWPRDFFLRLEVISLLVPSWLIMIGTFPGVIVHEMAHLLFCRIFRVEVLKVCYFRLGNPAGYVVHEVPENTYKHILISTGPFILNTLIGPLIAALGLIPHLRHKIGMPWACVAIWLGVSIAMHAFPSTGDARSIWSALWSRRAPIIARIVGTPIVGIIYIGSFCSVLWLDVIYGVAIAIGLPLLLMAHFG